MKTLSSEGIILKTYEFLLYLIPIIEKFPRSQKFLIADKIENKVISIQELFIEAYYTQLQSKKELLRKANIEIHKLRYLLRLTHDLRFLNHDRYGVVSEKIDEIGRMCGGWEKSLRT